MKAICLFFFLFFSCLSHKKTIQEGVNIYYFYFDAGKETMLKYPKNRGDGKPLKFLYVMDNTDNIIFISRNEKTWNNPKRIKISPEDTIHLNIKYRKWLNNMTNDEKYSFFYRRGHKIYNIIEKDTINGNLYLIKDMGFSQEIE